MTELLTFDDPHDHRLALGVGGLLGAFNEAGVLSSSDVRVAARIGAVAGEPDDEVLLALALVVRGVRHGSSCVPLGPLVAALAPDTPQLPWLEPQAWHAMVLASPLVTADVPVLRVDGDLIQLDRYHRLEVALCADLQARLATPSPEVDESRLTTDLERLFPEGYAEQRAAAEGAARRTTTVLVGGPGTGKTTALARLLAVLDAQFRAVHGRPPRVALAAPTGKAAARMREAVVEAATAPGAEGAFSPDERAWLSTLGSSTLHRLLGWLPGGGTRFRHDRRNRLPHDVVVVDETSMVSLELMARLLEAVRPDARLLLVGDAEQLASVEAGAVLRDVVDGWSGHPAAPVARLETTHRFGGAVLELAAALRPSATSDDVDADAVLEVLRRGDPTVQLVDPAESGLDAVVAEAALPSARAMLAAARAGDRAAARAALDTHRLLCAHRDGPFGASTWNARIEAWLADDAGGHLPGPWYPGRPVLVTENDAQLGLFNGDAGVTVADGDTVAVWFDDRSLAPSRLGAVQTSYAMTVHRSQGSQFDAVTVVLPDDSRLLTRELLYTAVTRARHTVTVVGTEESVRAAVGRRVLRSSGVAGRLARPSTA